MIGKRMPTIVEICTKYVDLTQETGGVSNSVREICAGLERRELRTVLVCGNRQRGSPQGKTGHFKISKWLDVFVIPQGCHPLLGPTKELKRVLGSIDKPWIGHVHTCFSAFTETAMYYMKRNRVPFIFTPRGKLSPEFFLKHRISKNMWWKLYARKTVSSATKIVIQSQGESRSFHHLGLSKDFQVVPNGYRIAGNNKDYKGKTRIIDEPYILFLGPLDPRKRPDFLVNAYARSQAKLSHKLIIVGPDSYGYKDKVINAVNKHKLNNRVVLYGPAYSSEKWQILSQACCICLPSRAEGFPLVLCEAIGAGLPMIFSKECNFEEAARAGAAIEMENFDESVWGAAIDKICLSKESRTNMSEASKRLAPIYNWDHIVEMWIKAYESLARSCVQH